MRHENIFCCSLISVEPTIVQNSEDAEIISASYNQTISAECEAQGNPLPNIIWKYSHHFENSTEHAAEGDLFNVRYVFILFYDTLRENIVL